MDDPNALVHHAAIVLAGGRSSRMGRDKLAMTVAGQSVLQRTVEASLSWAQLVVVVGPQPRGWHQDTRVIFTLEEPRFSGPAAGICAAIPPIAARADKDAEVLVLAGDLAFPKRVLAALVTASMGPDGTVLRDLEGWPQHLAGRYMLPALVSAKEEHPDPRDISVRRLLCGLQLTELPVPESVSADLDSPEDFSRPFVL